MKPINLSRREKYYVSAAAGVILVLLVFQLVISPLLNRRERLNRGLAEKTAELQEIQSLQAEYLDLEKRVQRANSELANREKNFSLFSYLDRLAGEIGIKDNVTRMDPSSDFVVEVTIKTITMEQFTRYLHQVEYSGNNLFVKRMSISETSKPEGYIDVVLQVETVES